MQFFQHERRDAARWCWFGKVIEEDTHLFVPLCHVLETRRADSFLQGAPHLVIGQGWFIMPGYPAFLYRPVVRE
jgi:hypothetical protein